MSVTESMKTRSGLGFELPSEDTLLVHLTGEWKLSNKLPAADEVMKYVDEGPKIRRITFDTEGLQGWDSGLLIFLIRVQELASQARTITVEQGGLLPGVKRLLGGICRSGEKGRPQRGGENIVSRQTGGICIRLLEVDPSDARIHRRGHRCLYETSCREGAVPSL